VKSKKVQESNLTFFKYRHKIKDESGERAKLARTAHSNIMLFSERDGHRPQMESA